MIYFKCGAVFETELIGSCLEARPEDYKAHMSKKAQEMMGKVPMAPVAKGIVKDCPSSLSKDEIKSLENGSTKLGAEGLSFQIKEAGDKPGYNGNAKEKINKIITQVEDKNFSEPELSEEEVGGGTTQCKYVYKNKDGAKLSLILHGR